MKNNELNNILSECLDRMLKGESIENCLHSYPGYAKELEPLLRTAQSAKIMSGLKPSTQFKAKARYEFQSALNRMEAPKSERHSFFHWPWRWQSGWAMAVISSLVVIVAGGSTVAAASGSMPDSTLYPVKLATEQVEMTFTFSDIRKAELNAKLADKRVEEIEYSTSKGDSQRVQAVAQRLNNNLQNVTRLVGENDRQDSGRKTPAPAASSAVATPVVPRPMLAATAPSAAPPMAGSGLTPAAATAPSFAPALAPAPGISQGAESKDAKSGNQESRSDSGPSADKTSTTPAKSNSGKDSEREKLKKTITDNAQSHEARLNAALSKASPEVRPALRQALSQSISEYDRAKETLDQAGDH